jgi:hypothetical protein
MRISPVTGTTGVLALEEGWIEVGLILETSCLRCQQTTSL